MRRALGLLPLGLSACFAINSEFDPPSADGSGASEVGSGTGASAETSESGTATSDSGGDGDSGDGDGDGDGDETTGDGTTGDGTTGDGDGDTGDGDGTTGDGDGTAGDGDGTSGDGDGDGTSGDGTSGDGDGTSGDGDGTSGDGDGTTACGGFPGLIACYELELTVMSTILDSGPNALHGGHAGLTTAPGVSGNAAVFSLSAKAVAGTDPLFSPPNVTAAAWIRPDALPSAGTLAPVLFRPGQFELAISDSGRVSVSISGGPSWAQGAVSPGVWTHVAFSYDTEIRSYQDGQSLGGVTIPSPPPFPAGSGEISIGSNDTDQFIGRIDRVEIYDNVLTPTQVCGLAGC